MYKTNVRGDFWPGAETIYVVSRNHFEEHWSWLRQTSPMLDWSDFLSGIVCGRDGYAKAKMQQAISTSMISQQARFSWSAAIRGARASGNE